MAYVEQSDVSLGDLITTAYLNQAKDNDIAMKALIDGMAAPIGEDYEKVVSSVSETTVASWTISADGMGTDGFFWVWAAFRGYNNTGGAVTLTIKVKLGSTTIFNSGALAIDVGQYAFRDIRTICQNVDNAAVQWAYTTFQYDNTITAATLDTQQLAYYYQTATEDTTGDLTLAITCQLSVNNANAWVEIGGAQLIGPIDPT